VLDETKRRKVMDDKIKQEVYEYLNELRESGVTNMYGARPYLQEEFNFTKEEARKWLTAWMKDF